MQAALKLTPGMMMIKDPFYHCAHMLRIHTAEQSYTANHLQAHHIELALAFPRASLFIIVGVRKHASVPQVGLFKLTF